MAEQDGALYVSAVEGHHVTRYGTPTLIGCEIDLAHPGNIRWNEQAIVRIPELEYLTYKREYDRLVEDGALVKQSAEDYEAFLELRDDKIEADAEAAAEAAKAAEAARKVGAARGAASNEES